MALNIGIMYLCVSGDHSLVSGDCLFEVVLSVQIFIPKSGYELPMTTIRTYWCWRALVVVEWLSL